MTEHYLDNSATTCVCDTAAKKAYEVMTKNYGNPSSLHSKGIAAEHELEDAREIIADSLCADSREIIFTSGGTESNNLALLGAAQAKKRSGNKIITTSIEHSSVFEAAQTLEKWGFEVIYLKPEQNGMVSLESVLNAVDESTILVSIMAVNNETGVIMPIDKISSILKLKRCNAIFHVDAVQAFCKMPLYPQRMGIDLMSISSHKVHGPKGAGALYIRKGVRILPRSFGGEQEKKFRAGTEPLPAIAGFAAAVNEININADREKFRELNVYLRGRLNEIPEVIINSPENAASHIINISVVGIKSETMLHYLAERKVFVSSGSACSKGKKSRILQSQGLSDARIDSALRISFSKYNDKSDVDALVEGIKDGAKILVRR